MAGISSIWNSRWWRVIELFFLPLLLFMCCFVFYQTYDTQKIQVGCTKDIEAIRKGIEDDKAQWDVLRKYDDSIRELQIEVEVLKRMQTAYKPEVVETKVASETKSFKSPYTITPSVDWTIPDSFILKPSAASPDKPEETGGTETKTTTEDFKQKHIRAYQAYRDGGKGGDLK